MESILHDRGVSDVVIGDVLHSDIATQIGKKFDTLLMLMNGIGMVGEEQRFSSFFNSADRLLSANGQIICDSIDVSVTEEKQHVSYREQNLANGKHAGQQRFTMTCEGAEPIDFDWLHIDFITLTAICNDYGWNTELILSGANGHYLCRIKRKTD